MTPFQINIFRNTAAPKFPNNILRNPLSCCLISRFTVSLTASINIAECYNVFFIYKNIIPFPHLR